MSAALKLGQKARSADTEAARVSWPSPAWRGRHLEFACDVLGKRTLAKHQRDILDAYYSAARVDIVVCTGQKLGKTECEIIIAAFDFATEKGLEGLLIGPKVEHTEKVFWKRFCIDILAAYYPCKECMPKHRAWCALVESNPHDETARPERCPKCSPLIPSEMKDQKRAEKGRVSEWLSVDSCEKGLRAPDGRTIAAYTSRKEGGQGGFSGKVRIYADECSDVSDEVRRSCKGNMSGGGKAIWFGNLLHPHGWFARAFKTEQGLFTAVFQISSRLSPNIPGRTVWSDGKVTANDNGDRAVPGMANREGIESNLKEWRNTPNLIAARIDAEHVKHIEGQLAPMASVLAAEQRWNAGIGGDGVLQIGVDVARMRDALTIAPRRGRRILELFAEALKQDDHVMGAKLVADTAKRLRRPGEDRPRVVFDKSGKEGQDFGRELERYADEIEIIGIVATFPPRDRKRFDKIRDEIAFHFAEWLRLGALPPDAELEAEIEVTTAKTVKFHYKGAEWEVQQVISNGEVRKMLGRSPDKRNACELAVWKIDGSAANDVPPPPEDKLAFKPEEKSVVVPIDKAKRRKAEPQHDDDYTADPWGAADAGLRAAWGGV